MELINKKKLQHKNKTQKTNASTTAKTTNTTNVNNNTQSSSTDNRSNTKQKENTTPIYKEYVGVNSPSLKKIKNNILDTGNNTPKANDNDHTSTELEGIAISDFKQEDVDRVWQEFVDKIKKTRVRFYQLFKNQTPKLTNDYVLEINTNNKSQKKDIEEEIYKEVLLFLKQQLNNSKISIQINILEGENEELIYGDTSVYQYLAKKNDILNTLKEVFNLDFE